MADPIFQILGSGVPPLIGRKQELERLSNALTKPTPDHLQIVGPRFVGKTVLLHALARSMRAENSRYRVVIVWDLGHQTPDTDEGFLMTLRDCVANALMPINEAYQPVAESGVFRAVSKPFSGSCGSEARAAKG